MEASKERRWKALNNQVRASLTGHEAHLIAVPVSLSVCFRDSSCTLPLGTSRPATTVLCSPAHNDDDDRNDGGQEDEAAEHSQSNDAAHVQATGLGS